MLKITLAAVTAAALLSTPALAGSNSPTTGATTEGKMVCKRQALTGTRFAKKLCWTAEQWDAKAEADRRAMADMTMNQVQRETKRD